MILRDLPIIMVRCLILTVIIEVLVALLLGVRNKKDLLNVMLVNIITNPIVVSLPHLLLIYFGYSIYRVSFYVLEVVTVLFEGLIYKKVLNYKKINPFLLSLLLNGSSYLIGEIINRFL